MHTRSLIVATSIRERIGEVDRQIHHHTHGRYHKDHALDHGIVPV